MRTQRARVLLGLAIALGAVATTATTSTAETATAYNATFPQELTVQRTCPQGFPPHAFCFTGSDHSQTGTSSPPTPTDGRATEDYAGFVDFDSPVANACGTNVAGYPDHNVVAISTYAGRLFLTTDGVDCVNTGTDDGVWHAFGGTGIFEGATGSGTVHTQATGGKGTAAEPITSFSKYTGTLTFDKSD
jgi:hypothetical protein